MKIKFFIETNWPRDKKRVRGLTGVEWEQTTEFPVLPRVGDMIALNVKDDYREVEQVFIRADGDMAVHFKFLDEVCWAKDMKHAGWVEQY